MDDVLSLFTFTLVAMAGNRGGIEAGKAFIRAYLDDSLFSRGMRRMEVNFRLGLRKMERAAKEFGPKLQGSWKAALAFGAPVGVGLHKALGSIRESAQLDKTAKAFGVTAEAASGLFGVFKANGAENARESIESLVTLSGRVKDVLEGTGEESQKLFDGLDVTAEEMSKLPIDEQFFRLHEAIMRLPDPMDRINRLMLAFGEDGGKTLIGTLSKSTAELRAQAAGFRQTRADLDAATKAQESMGRALAALDRVWQALASSLAPILEDMAERATPLVKRFAAWAKENKGLVATLVKVGAAVAGLAFALTGFGYAMSGVASAIGAAKTAIGLLSAVSLPALGAALAAVAIGYFAMKVYEANAAVRALNAEIARSKGLDTQISRGQEKRRKAVVDEAEDILDPAARAEFLRKAIEQADRNAQGARGSASGARRDADRLAAIDASASAAERLRGSVNGVVNTTADGRPIFGEIAIGSKVVEQRQLQAEQAEFDANLAEDFSERLRDMLRATERGQEIAAASPAASGSGDVSPFLSAWNAGVDKLVGGIEGAAETLGLITPKLSTMEWLGQTFEGGPDGESPEAPSIRAQASDAVNRAALVGSNEGIEAVLRGMTGGGDATTDAVKAGNKTLASIDSRIAKQKPVVIGKVKT